MRRRFEILFRCYIALLVVVLLWSVWHSAAQTNRAVEILEPVDGTRFPPGTNITFVAGPSPDLGGLQRMEFLIDGQLLGTVSNAPYSFVWTNAAAGAHRLSARAVPETGDAVVSGEIRFRVYNAYLTFGLDRVGLLQRPVFGVPLWKYCASLLYIFLAFYISKLLDFLTRVWLKKWAQRTASRFDDLLLELLNGPVKVVSFIVFLWIGLDIFDWPVLVQDILAKGFAIIVAVSLTYMVLKFIDLVMGYWRKKAPSEVDATFDQLLFPIVRKSLKAFVIAVAALVTLDNIGVNITGLIASLSIGGLAVGLAAQDTLANLFGAVSIFVDKPFKIGDRIQLDNVDGVVETIGMRSTRVRNLDGHLITVPNKTMGNATIINITRRPNIKTIMNIGVTYDTPVEKVQRALAILQDIYKTHPKTVDVWISFDQFADSSLNIKVIHWWNSTDYKDYLGGMQELNLKIKAQFDSEGISFAFPTRTLYVKQDSDWRLANETPELPER